jgi:hypothetical protein
MASLSKRPDRPKNDPRYDVRYRDPDRRMRTQTFRRKADGETFSDPVETNIDGGEWINPSLARTTFGPFADQVEAARVNRRASTRARDTTYMKRVRAWFGDVELGRFLRST